MFNQNKTTNDTLGPGIILGMPNRDPAMPETPRQQAAEDLADTALSAAGIKSPFVPAEGVTPIIGDTVSAPQNAQEATPTARAMVVDGGLVLGGQPAEQPPMPPGKPADVSPDGIMPIGGYEAPAAPAVAQGNPGDHLIR